MNFSANLMIHYSANGTIHFSYSHIHRPQSDDTPAQAFHTRQLSYPVIVTVYHMLECHGMDILPFPSSLQTTVIPLMARRRRGDVIFSSTMKRVGVCFRSRYGIPMDYLSKSRSIELKKVFLNSSITQVVKITCLIRYPTIDDLGDCSAGIHVSVSNTLNGQIQ